MSGAALLDHLVGAGGAVWRASWQASVLAVLVLAVQLVFGRRIAPRWRHAMWMLVFVRLALPVVPSSPVSVFNLAPAHAAANASPADAPPVAGSLSTAQFAAEMRARAAGFTPGANDAPLPIPPAAAARQKPGLWAGWPQALAALWAAGAMLLAARVAWATVRVSRTMRGLQRVDDESTLALLRATAAELRVRRPPVLLTGDELFSPALVGFLRPRLLLPSDLLSRFESAELRLVLLHELAHLKRRDVLANWFATLLTVLHWPNPVAWLAAWRLRLDRELATDELVMSLTTTVADRRAYGHTIVKLLETFSRAARQPVPAGGVGILEGKQQMKRRITMIAQFATRTRAWTVIAASLVLGLGLVALTDAAEQKAPPAQPSPAVSQPSGTTKPSVPGADERNRVEPAGEKVAAAGDAKRLSTLIAPNELVTVSVMGLVGPDVETLKTSRVDADGNIRLPYVGEVKAEGLRPGELEKAILKAYKDQHFVNDALVVVSLPGRGESHQLSGKRERAGEGERPEPVGAAGGGGGGGRGLFGGSGGEQMDPAVAAQLDRKLPEVSFDAVPFSDAVDFLRDVTSGNIFVDWRALEAAGIDRNAPVTVRLRDVAFKDALTIILRGLSHDLYFNAENAVLQIGINAGERQAEMFVRGYEVADLIQMAGDPKSAAAELAKVIATTVQPDFWRLPDGSGGTGTVSAFGNKVVVTATEPVHRDVIALLKVLREPPKDSVKAEDMTLEQIAGADQQMLAHLQAKQEMELKIEQLKASGINADNPTLKAVNDLLKIRGNLIKERADFFRQKYKGYRFTPDGGMIQGAAAQEKAEEVAKAEAEALWAEKYAPRLVKIGADSNLEQLKAEFKAELDKRAAERAAKK
jgi:beta-lactamase regulating signal transducer with metallopeptidase domain